ncbi:unnamed protein product, partial [Rotaria sp. Silwood2]
LISYLKEIVLNNDYYLVLFEIDADPQLNSTQPFANMTPLNYSVEEQTILFMSNSLFRIINIQHDKNTFTIIRMKLCSQNDQDFKNILII